MVEDGRLLRATSPPPSQINIHMLGFYAPGSLHTLGAHRADKERRPLPSSRRVMRAAHAHRARTRCKDLVCAGPFSS